jgi:hypothetical protein
MTANATGLPRTPLLCTSSMPQPPIHPTRIMPRAEFPSQRARTPETPPVSPGCPPALCVAHPNSHRVPCGIILVTPANEHGKPHALQAVTGYVPCAPPALCRVDLRPIVIFFKATVSTLLAPPHPPLARVISGRAGSARPGHHGSERGCRSSWSTRPDAPTIPGSCECRIQHPAGASQSCAGIHAA